MKLHLDRTAFLVLIDNSPQQLFHSCRRRKCFFHEDNIQQHEQKTESVFA